MAPITIGLMPNPMLKMGELYPEDCDLNDQAVKYGDRILSAYKLGAGQRLWVITEADRSVTTLLLPSEY